MSQINFADLGTNEDNNNYRGLAITINNEIGEEWESQGTVERVVALMRAGDQQALEELSSWQVQEWTYRDALTYVMDAALQLELGCLLLRRAGTGEAPLCEHLLDSRAWEHWMPETRIHSEIEDGPPAMDSEGAVRLAVGAYTNAWYWYSSMSAGSSWWGWSPASLGSFVRSLIALDGLRVCHEALDETARAWATCEWLSGWLDDCEHNFEKWPGELNQIVDEVKTRFARSEGRLQPLFQGRQSAVQRLQRELEWWDLLPQGVKDSLGDAEYARTNLKDPTFNPKRIVAAYCEAVEGMLQRRLGEPVDILLRNETSGAATEFKAQFLQDRRNDKVFKEWLCGGLTIGQFERNLRKSQFRNMLSKAGVDAAYYFRDLPDALRNLLVYRNPASHASPKVFTEQDVSDVRTQVLGVLQRLARMRVTTTFDEVADA